MYALLSGVLFGFYFALLALGLNLIFGVMRIINLAHGEFIMLGAYGAFVAYHYGHISPLLSIVFVLVIFFALGALLYFPLVPRLLESRDPEMLSLIMFFGLSQVLEALAVMAFGNNPQSLNQNLLGGGQVNFAGQQYQVSWITSATISLVAIGLVWAFLYRTRLGFATRAVMGDREEAKASGLNVHRISLAIFGLGLGLAGVAGVLAPFMLGSINPAMGISLTSTAFAVVVIGSLGSPIGTIIGGLIYGISTILMQTYFSSWASMVPYVLLLLIILVKPSGIFGKGVRSA